MFRLGTRSFRLDTRSFTLCIRIQERLDLPRDRLDLLWDRLDKVQDRLYYVQRVQDRLYYVQRVQDRLDWVRYSLDWVWNHFSRVCDQLIAEILLLFHVVGLWTFSFRLLPPFSLARFFSFSLHHPPTFSTMRMIPLSCPVPNCRYIRPYWMFCLYFLRVSHREMTRKTPRKWNILTCLVVKLQLWFLRVLDKSS